MGRCAFLADRSRRRNPHRPRYAGMLNRVRLVGAAPRFVCFPREGEWRLNLEALGAGTEGTRAFSSAARRFRRDGWQARWCGKQSRRSAASGTCGSSTGVVRRSPFDDTPVKDLVTLVFRVEQPLGRLSRFGRIVSQSCGRCRNLSIEGGEPAVKLQTSRSADCLPDPQIR